MAETVKAVHKPPYKSDILLLCILQIVQISNISKAIRLENDMCVFSNNRRCSMYLYRILTLQAKNELLIALGLAHR